MLCVKYQFYFKRLISYNQLTTSFPVFSVDYNEDVYLQLYFFLQNNAISNLNEVLRQQNKRIQHIHNNNQELLDAIEHIIKQLKVKIVPKVFQNLTSKMIKSTNWFQF